MLQIFINFGLLEEAYELCIDYTTSLVTNKDTEEFDIKVCFKLCELFWFFEESKVCLF